MAPRLRLNRLPKSPVKLSFLGQTPGVPEVLLPYIRVSRQNLVDPSHPFAHKAPTANQGNFPRWTAKDVPFNIAAVPKALLSQKSPNFPPQSSGYFRPPSEAGTDEVRVEDGKQAGISLLCFMAKASLHRSAVVRNTVFRRLKTACSLIMKHGADSETHVSASGKERKRLVARQGDDARKYILSDWTYVVWPKLEVYRMPYKQLVPFLRQAFKQLHARAVRMHAEWYNLRADRPHSRLQPVERTTQLKHGGIDKHKHRMDRTAPHARSQSKHGGADKQQHQKDAAPPNIRARADPAHEGVKSARPVVPTKSSSVPTRIPHTTPQPDLGPPVSPKPARAVPKETSSGLKLAASSASASTAPMKPSSEPNLAASSTSDWELIQAGFPDFLPDPPLQPSKPSVDSLSMKEAGTMPERTPTVEGAPVLSSELADSDRPLEETPDVGTSPATVPPRLFFPRWSSQPSSSAPRRSVVVPRLANRRPNEDPLPTSSKLAGSAEDRSRQALFQRKPLTTTPTNPSRPERKR